jgi:UDP-GlcNAc3NAcA epimerase
VLLGIGAGHPVEQTARIAAACSHVLMTRRPRVVVVIGDTNSTLGCAIAARQLLMPLIHVEAGLRSGVMAMAEERNRVSVDAMSQLLCAPSPAAVENLVKEGIEGEIACTGDIARDVMQSVLDRVPSRSMVPEIPGGLYALVTLHRAELTDHRSYFESVLRGLGSLELPLVLPLHPRTRRRLEEFGLAAAVPSNVQLVEPLGYLANLAAVRHASLVITDSGGVQREAYWLGRPCITLRTETEWTETVQCGANRLVPPARAALDLAGAVDAAMAGPLSWPGDAYGSGDAAERIVGTIASMLVTTGHQQRSRTAP